MAKNKETRRITVSVLFGIFELTALLLKKIHLRLHCYTQRYAEAGYPEAY